MGPVTRVALLLLGLTLGALATVQEGYGGPVHGGAYYLKAPAGWVFDDESLVEYGGELMLIPVGTSQSTAPVKIFASGADNEALDWALEEVRRSLQVDDPSVRLTDLPPVRTADGHLASVVGCSPRRKSGFASRHAFIPTGPSRLYRLELWARPERLEEGARVFDTVIASFRVNPKP